MNGCKGSKDASVIRWRDTVCDELVDFLFVELHSIEVDLSHALKEIMAV